MTDYNNKIFGEKGGKGGGGGSTRVAQEEPNTLQSNATARIIDLISEGPVVGLVDGFKSIYLDDTPLQNDDDTFNFEGIEIEERTGYPEQASVPGFSEVESSQDISAQIKQNQSITRSITDTNADACRVTVQIPALTEQNRENGDLKGSEVEIAIDVRNNNNNNFQQLKTDKISGKTTSPYQRSYRINLPGSGPWDVRVRRLTADNTDDSSIRNDTYFSTLTTIIDGKFTYPDSAYVALKVDAQQFGNQIPNRSYHVRGIIVSVPDNYDPDRRTYSGLWSGNFKKSWTNNPAWIFYDLATNKRYGAGLEHVDKWSLYQISKYCDQFVPNGYGEDEPRFTINTVLNTREDAYKVLNSLCSAFRGMLFWGAGEMTAVQDAPADPSRFFGRSNVIDGEFRYTQSRLKTRHTVALVTYNDPDDNYRKNVEYVEDAEGIKKYGYNQTDITAFGCSSRGQARRLGLWTLYSERSETDTIEFSVGLADADVRPGEIISISDPNYTGARLSGRLVGTNTNQTLKLDKAPAENLGSNITLSVMLPTGAVEHRAVRAIGKDTVTLEQPLSNVPVDNAIWMLSSSAVNARLFRVINVTDDGDNRFTISALEHDQHKYARVEQGLQIPDTSQTLLPTGPLTAPLEITVESYTYITGGTTHQGALVSWTPSADPRVRSYIIEMLSPSDFSFKNVGTTAVTSIDIRDVEESGQYQFRVASVDSTGRRSPWSVRVTTLSSMLLPVPPDSVDIEAGTFSVTLIPRSSRREQLYEFYRSLTPLKNNQITTNATFCGASTTLSDNNLKSNTLYYYYVRGYSKYGVSAFYAVQVNTLEDFDDILGAVNDELRREGGLVDLFNTKTNRIAGNVDRVTRQIADTDKIANDALQEARENEFFAGELQEDINEYQAEYEGRTSKIEDNYVTLSTEQLSLARRVENISSTTEDNSASIKEVRRTTTAKDAAQAVHNTNYQLKSSLGSAMIDIERAIVYDPVNGAVARAVTTVQVGERRALLGIQVDNTVAEIVAIADRFAVINPVSGEMITAFVVEDGRVLMPESFIGQLTVDKLRSTDGTLAFENGKLRADLIDVNNLDVNNLRVKWGQIEDVVVGRGQIGDAAVDTLEIAGNAVTTPASSTSMNAMALADRSWTTVASVWMDPQGAPTIVSFGFQAEGNDFSRSNTIDRTTRAYVEVRVRLLTPIRHFDLGIAAFTEERSETSASVSLRQYVNGLYTAGGTGNYELQVRHAGGVGSSCAVSARTIFAMGVKR